MMHSLSQWLMKADARRIFACYLTALFIVLAWWTWRILAPLGDEVLPTQTAGKEKAGQTGLGIIAFLANELARTQEPPQGVFRSPELQPPPQQQSTQQRRGKSSDQPPPAKPATFSLTYRGMLQRTDGKLLALIEDTKSKDSRFYSSGQTVCGFKIADIRTDTVSCTGPDGADLTLKIKVPKVFMEGKQ